VIRSATTVAGVVVFDGKVPMTRIRIAVAAGLAGIAATVGLAGVADAAPVNLSWAVAPSTQNGPDGRTHYTYTDVKPGTLVHDFVGITNYSTQPVTFSVYASDGVATYLRVAGPLHPALSVDSAGTNGFHGTVNPFGGGSTTVSYTVHNTGNVRLSGRQEVTVTGLFGIPLATVHPTSLQQMLPGGSVRIVAHLSGVFPAGPLDVHVKVTPAEVPGSPHLTVPLVAGSYTVSVWATPWPQLGLLILLVATAFGVLWWLRGRRRRRSDLLAAAVEQGRREAQLAAVSAGEDTE
jgi:hypothetical protein